MDDVLLSSSSQVFALQEELFQVKRELSACHQGTYDPATLTSEACTSDNVISTFATDVSGIKQEETTSNRVVRDEDLSDTIDKSDKMGTLTDYSVSPSRAALKRSLWTTSIDEITSTLLFDPLSKVQDL